MSVAAGYGAARVRGRVFHWPRLYDRMLAVITLGKEERVREMILDLAGIAPGEKVLDVGCGTGSLAVLAAKRVGPTGEVRGIDPSPEMIEAARAKCARAEARAAFRDGVMEDIPYPEGHFDLVLSSFMLHHLPAEVRKAGFEEVHRVLAPGGRLLVVDIEPQGSTAMGALYAFLIGHGGIGGNVNALPGILEDVGFIDVETGRASYGPLSYALAAKGEATSE